MIHVLKNVSLTRVAVQRARGRSGTMDSIIYLVGLIVIIMFILSFLGLR